MSKHKKTKVVSEERTKQKDPTLNSLVESDLQARHRNLLDIMDKMITLFQDKEYDTLTREEKDVANRLLLLNMMYVDEGCLTRKKQ